MGEAVFNPQEYSPTHCQNCGWNSHCGAPNLQEVKDLSKPDHPHIIEVCKHCRCKLCIEKDTKEI